MDTDLDFDPSQYTRLPPYLDQPMTLALSRQLLAETSPAWSPGAKRSGAALARAAAALEAAMEDALRTPTAQNRRPIDLQADRLWASVEQRLGAWLALSEEEAEVGEARALHGQLFGEGLRFTQLEYGAQWAEAEARLGMLKKSGQLPTLERLCGPRFVAALLKNHAEYAAMVGTKKVAGAAKTDGAMTPGPDGTQLRKATLRAILAHQVQLVAMRMSPDAAERSVAERALRRVDEYREKLAPSRPAKKEDPVSPALPAERMAAAAGLG